MKIGKYIIEIVPNDSINHSLNLPYHNDIIYKNKKEDNIWSSFHKLIFQKCKHVKPNTGIRYSILGKYWIFLVIKQLN